MNQPGLQMDSLPSWHEGAIKQSIFHFVQQVTAEGGMGFVSPLERIVVFDNDGTLWIDEPLQMMATLMRLGRPASDIMVVMAGKEDAWKTALSRARRTDVCPCDSALKFVECHGWKRPDCGRKRRGTAPRRPRPPVRERKYV